MHQGPRCRTRPRDAERDDRHGFDACDRACNFRHRPRSQDHRDHPKTLEPRPIDEPCGHVYAPTMANTAAWAIGGILVAGAIGTAIYFATKKDDTKPQTWSGSVPTM